MIPLKLLATSSRSYGSVTLAHASTSVDTQNRPVSPDWSYWPVLTRPLREEAGIRVYGVSHDSPEQLRAFADEHDVTYELLSDADSAVIREFGILDHAA